MLPQEKYSFIAHFQLESAYRASQNQLRGLIITKGFSIDYGPQIQEAGTGRRPRLFGRRAS